MHPHHIERHLRGLPANRFAIAREASAALFNSTRVRDSHMHGANWFFVGAAARASNASDADSQRAAHAPANPFRQGATATSGLTAPLAAIISAGTSAHAVFSSLL